MCLGVCVYVCESVCVDVIKPRRWLASIVMGGHAGSAYIHKDELGTGPHHLIY